MTNEELIAGLRSIADRHWHAFQQPILLSQLPQALTQHLNADFKSVLGTGSLKRFIKESEAAGGYRLVEHPTQRARLGIVPENVEFEFVAEVAAPTSLAISDRDVEGFLRVLRSMSSEERVRLSIPASVVIRLLDRD